MCLYVIAGNTVYSLNFSAAEINDHLSTSPAYLVAMECISFLMKDGHSETDKIFRIPGNVGKLKKYLDVIDSYKVCYKQVDANTCRCPLFYYI